MTPEETLVYQSLAPHYCFDPEKSSPFEVAPGHVLYGAYVRYANEIGQDPGSILNPTQFGVAFRRIFDIAPDRRARVRVCGKPQWGYRHVRGPGAIRANETKGNPNWRRNAPVLLPASRGPLAC